MEEVKREEKREKLIRSWNKFTNGFLYGDEAFCYEKCSCLIRRTRDYFNTMPISGILTTDDCRLYEAASVLRFMPDSYCPQGAKKDEFRIVRLRLNSVFADFETKIQ